MSVYNVEIFSGQFKYKNSVQIQTLEYEFDYLDIEKNKIKHPDLRASKGDYIRITGKTKIVGVVSDVIEDKNTIELEYKSFMSLFDVKIYTAISSMKTIEQWLKKTIEELYINNTDALQNVYGLQVITTTETVGSLDYEDGINNLYEIIVSAFTVYGILVDFDINVGAKRIFINVGKKKLNRFTIESYLPNVKEIKVTLKEDDSIKNKCKIYNSENLAESVTYYLDQDDNVTTSPKTRKKPVGYIEVLAKGTNKKTFAEVAETKAIQTLKPSRLDNLIEVTCSLNDPIIKPYERFIGQTVHVITKDGTRYVSELTGYEYKESEARLIFGAIRLELTKQLKKWRRSQ